MGLGEKAHDHGRHAALFGRKTSKGREIACQRNEVWIDETEDRANEKRKAFAKIESIRKVLSVLLGKK